jgi:two-component system, OmpR family, sensor histidine kinase KdpD
MIDERPDPDTLLKRIQADESETTAARLKIFFGPYPGVGKTFAMLEAARERKREGVDVVVGVVETHGRPETAALLKDLEVLPRKEISYKGITLQEFDLDAALARKPDLIILDELAHTNHPGSRHAKRWQDVEELLDAGISVYTTLNVQHWESLNDIVAQITGVRVRETVPDNFLQKAHEVELVDLPPADLLKRMSEGKVYVGDQAIRAAENFFQLGNLIALRELALRHTAERVDAQMQEFKNRYAISKVLPVRDRILVGITASPHSTRLIRATLRLATSLRCEWITVYVQTPDHQKLPSDQKARIIDTLRLAERLGGETAVLTGQNISEEILKYARGRNVTKIVLGKPSEPRWKELLFGSTINDVARHSAEIDLYVISTINISDEAPKRYKAEEKEERKGFLQATIAIAACTLISWLLVNKLDRTNLIMFYLLVVLWIAYKFGRPAAIYASVVSVLAFDFFLVPPYFTFAVSDTEYLITFVMMLVVAVFISTVTGRLFAYAEATRNREERLRSMYRVSRTLSEISDQSTMLQTVCREIEEFFKAPAMLLIAGASEKLRVVAGDAQMFGFSGNEIRTAEWVHKNGEIAGHGTDTLAGSKGIYVPLKGRQKILGVLSVRLPQESELIEPEQLQVLETFASEIGEALENKELSEAAGRATASMEAERLKNLVLRSFSYDLAAPSQQIAEVARRLSDQASKCGPEFSRAIENLYEKSQQINRVVARLPDYLEDEFPSSVEEPYEVDGSKPAQTVDLSSALSSNRILFFSHADEKTSIIQKLVETLPVADPETVLRSIHEREEVGGILIRSNVAIPHTTVSGMDGVVASLGIQRDGSDDANFFWLLFASGSESTKEHLEFLRSVAQTLTDDTLSQLARAKTSQEAYAILTKAEAIVR